MRSRALVACFTVMVLSPWNNDAFAGPPDWVGIGTSSCAEFGQHYKENPSMTQMAYYSWAQGYASGVAAMLNVSGAKTIDLNPLAKEAELQFDSFKAYCDAHPLRIFGTAIILWLQKSAEN